MNSYGCGKWGAVLSWKHWKGCLWFTWSALGMALPRNPVCRGSLCTFQWNPSTGRLWMCPSCQHLLVTLINDKISSSCFSRRSSLKAVTSTRLTFADNPDLHLLPASRAFSLEFAWIQPQLLTCQLYLGHGPFQHLHVTAPQFPTHHGEDPSQESHPCLSP